MRRVWVWVWVWIAAGCAPKAPAPAAVEVPPAAEAVPGQVDLGASGEVIEAAAETAGASPRVELDGALVDVWWDDGDTFSYTDAATGKRIRARMVGFNTLESYGPVHRWGQWTGWELYDLAKTSMYVAKGRAWACSDTGGEGGYGRIAVDCPELRRELLRTGLAHAFAIDETPDPEDLAVQQAAIAAGEGMWAKGAPTGLVTSLHSGDEGSGAPYNRVCSLETGMCPAVEHSDTYGACEEVCLDDAGSCMTYVPYKQRYGDSRAACLRRQ